VETFAQIRELARTVSELSNAKEAVQQKSLMQKGGEIFSDILGSELETTDTETTFKINFALMSFEHSVKKRKKEK
jgi:hypothetical protein